MRKRYYKGLEPSLQGPHFNNPDGALYLPGTEHRSKLHVTSAFGKGIHYTSRNRVASRWAPVVAEVEVLGAQFLIPEKVAPRYRKDIPASLAMGRYNKYRTDHLRVVRIVGIAAYGPLGGPTSPRDHSLLAAGRLLRELNSTLRDNDRPELRLTGVALERLRADNFQLWEVEEVPEPAWDVVTWTVSAPVRHGAAAGNDALAVDIRDFVAARLGVSPESVEVKS